MAEVRYCSTCGAPLRVEGGVASCPACAMRGAFESVGVDTQEDTPSPIELARSFGDYELLEEIARGGMGIVYKARQRSLDRVVAVKMIVAGRLADKEFVRRFRTEASTAAILQHPNIVAVHDVGVQHGQHFFSMDFVEGPNLAQVVGQRPLAAGKAARYVKLIAEAIHYAHERGILHRDLKPSNVLIDANDQPRITDFGLARRLESDSSLTMTGQVLGSPNFIPPEQAGAARAKVGPPSDVYALGGILYYLLTARAPFQGETLEATLHQVLNSEPISPRLLNPAVPLDLETVCLRCLEKEPARRYRSAQAVADELNRFLREEPILARPIGRAAKTWRWCRRKPVLAGLAASTGLLLLIVIIGSPIAAFRINRERQRAQQNLVRQYVANGNRLVEEGDLLGALPWFAKAIKEDSDHTARTGIHRLRFGTTLQQCPRLAQIWFHKDAVTDDTRFSPDGRWVLSAGSDGVARVWDVATGESISPPMQLSGPISCTAFSPDGQRVAVGNSGFDCGVWEVRTGRLLFPFLQHRGPIFSVNFSPDGHRLLTSSGDSTAQVWDADTGARIGQPMMHDAGVAGASLSPDGRRVVTASIDGTARIWNASTGEPISPALKHDHGLRMPEFSPDGKLVIAASYGPTAVLWDAVTFKQVAVLRHQDKVKLASFSPDGSKVVTASEDATAVVWDVWTFVPVASFKHRGPVNYVAFSPDGKYVVTSSADRTARVWDAATGKPMSAPLRHGSEVSCASFSPDGQRVVTASDDHTARVWELRPAELVPEATTRSAVARTASFSPDNGRAVVVCVDGTACVWDATTANPLSAVQRNLVAVRHAQFSPDSRHLAVASTNGAARVLDLATGAAVSPPFVHAGLVNHVEFSPDGKRVVTAGRDGFARVWEFQSGRLLTEMRHGESINHAAFTSDGKQIVTLSVSVPDILQAGAKRTFDRAEREAITATWGLVQIWNARTGQPVTPPRKLGRSVSQVAFSSKCLSVIPSCSARALTENQVSVIDLFTGRPRTRPLQHEKGVIHASFSPDGRLAVTASVDHTARLWNTAIGQAAGPSLEHEKAVFHASFSSDGRLIVTASEDQTARVWEVATGQPVTPPLKHGAAVNRAWFSPDASRLLTVASDGSIKVWNLAKENRSIEDEMLLAQLLAGQHIDDTGTVLPLSPQAIQDAWQKVRTKDADGSKKPFELVLTLQTPMPTTKGEFHPLTAGVRPEISQWEYHGHLGNAHFASMRFSTSFHSNDVEGVIEELSKSIDLEPDGPSGRYFARARAYLLTRQLQRALNDVRESLWRMDPVGPNKSSLGRDYLRRAQCYAWLGAHEKAEVDIQTALEYYSESKENPAQVYNLLARLYATGPEAFRSPEKALALALKAVELSKTNHNIFTTLGAVYYRLGQLTNAIETLEAGMKADSSGDSAHDFFFLAMSYHRLGNSVKAEDYYAQAMKWVEDPPETNQTWDEIGTLALSPEWKEELESFRAEAAEVLGKQKERRLPSRP